MTQANLLELAKKGNPQAIASLMNLVLEPKGVTAKTQLEGSCLHVVFTSEHSLSQSAIVGFVKNGLSTLGTKSFQTVKLYARKYGQDKPVWVETLITGVTSSVTPAVPSPPPAPVADKVTASLPTLNAPRTAVAAPPPAQSAGKRRSVAQAAPPLSFIRRWQQSFQEGPSWRQAWSRLKTPYKAAIAVSASAFLIGGTIALMTHTPAKSSAQSAAPSSTGSTLPLSSQAIAQPSAAQPTTPEAQVESYLGQMNQAQQAFYQTNGRFATTLEELERSAAVLSHSTHYTYRLVLRDETQSVLTATPKQEGLSSYSGTVLPVDAKQLTTMTTIICKTNQPSTYPPILAQATGQPILCPADATQVAN